MFYIEQNNEKPFSLICFSLLYLCGMLDEPRHSKLTHVTSVMAMKYLNLTCRHMTGGFYDPNNKNVINSTSGVAQFG